MIFKNQAMNQWYQVELGVGQPQVFAQKLNALVARHHGQVYYKVFTPKEKALKNTVFYIADEGSSVVEGLKKEFSLVPCTSPARATLTRVAGFSADRDWMFR